MEVAGITVSPQSKLAVIFEIKDIQCFGIEIPHFCHRFNMTCGTALTPNQKVLLPNISPTLPPLELMTAKTIYNAFIQFDVKGL